MRRVARLDRRGLTHSSYLIQSSLNPWLVDGDEVREYLWRLFQN